MKHFPSSVRHHDTESRLIFQGPELPKIADVKSEFEGPQWAKSDKEKLRTLDGDQTQEGTVNLLAEGLSPADQADHRTKKANADLAGRKTTLQSIDAQNATLTAKANGADEVADSAAELAKDAVPLGVLIDQGETKTAPRTASQPTERMNTTITSKETAETTSTIERAEGKVQAAASVERPVESAVGQEGAVWQTAA